MSTCWACLGCLDEATPSLKVPTLSRPVRQSGSFGTGSFGTHPVGTHPASTRAAAPGISHLSISSLSCREGPPASGGLNRPLMAWCLCVSRSEPSRLQLLPRFPAIFVGLPPTCLQSLASAPLTDHYTATLPRPTWCQYPPRWPPLCKTCLPRAPIGSNRAASGLTTPAQPTTMLPPAPQGNACNGRLSGAAGGAILSPSTQGGARPWLIPHRSTDQKHR